MTGPSPARPGPGGPASDGPAPAPAPGEPAPGAQASGDPAHSRQFAASWFRALHHGSRPLVLPNVWDAVSARVFAEAGFPALATSSGAIAAALGYADGQQTPAAEMFAAVTRIARSVDVPVTADIEAGYRLSPAELASRLAEAGRAGGMCRTPTRIAR
ncbi:MAG: isocitrate lyase/phosphoenolpyruvate mutase family protein [Streptosporangiaceae bacterium]|jgi:2-methylisocitrate lyase-like PEP mutase family enzyme